MAGALAGHTAPGDLVQFAFDERNEPVERAGVALSPPEEKRGGVDGSVGNAPL
jgi:hypothetical protein